MNTVLTILAFIFAILFIAGIVGSTLGVFLGSKIIKSESDTKRITTFPLIRGNEGNSKKPDATAPKKVFKPSKREIPATLLANGKKAVFVSGRGIQLRAKIVEVSRGGKMVWLRRGSIEFQRNLTT